MKAHEKEYKVFKDGDLWCAVNEEYINIQESVVGFGLTPMVALGELVMQEMENEYPVKQKTPAHRF